MYRSAEQAVLIALIGIIGSAVIAGIGLANSDSWAERAGWILFAGLLLWFYLFRCARSGVYVDAEGFRILNPLRTSRLGWADVRRFVIKRYGPFPLMAHAELTNDEAIHIFGIQGPNPMFRPHSRSAQNEIDALNRRLYQRTSGRSRNV